MNWGLAAMAHVRPHLLPLPTSPDGLLKTHPLPPLVGPRYRCRKAQRQAPTPAYRVTGWGLR